MRHSKLSIPVLFLAIFVLCFLPALSLARDGYSDLLMVRELSAADTAYNTNRWIDVPGRGPTLFYAQVNPFWAKMRYEPPGSSTRRNFGGSGCCPTTAAIAFANLLPASDLGKIRPFASTQVNGYGFSSLSMNPITFPRRVGIKWLDYAQDYQRYLPLVFGQYAAGNNIKRSSWRSEAKSNGGTGVGFVPGLCGIYGIEYLKVSGKMNMDWIAPVKQGAIGIALSNTRYQPFAASNAHYVAIVGCDDTHLYIMDPQDKAAGEYWDSDSLGVLEVIEKGLVRVKLTDFDHLYINVIYVITNEDILLRLASAAPS